MGSVEATFGGAFLHETIYVMAATYLYGICRSHPFIDGNGRTVVGAALVFLELNGIEVHADKDAFYEVVIGVAEGRVSKASGTVSSRRKRRTGGEGDGVRDEATAGAGGDDDRRGKVDRDGSVSLLIGRERGGPLLREPHHTAEGARMVARRLDAVRCLARVLHYLPLP
jgi:hypothetical protein